MQKINIKDIDYDKLSTYGFKRLDNYYLYQKDIVSNFYVEVKISDNTLYSKVIDKESGEEYILVDVETVSGKFVGIVRDAYTNLLEDIKKNCTQNRVYSTDNTNALINYVETKYNSHLLFLWKDSPNFGVFKHANGKWFGIIMVIPQNKLGLEGDNLVEIVNVHTTKGNTSNLIDNKTIFPAYHMNKNSWISILLKEIDLNTLYNLIDESFNSITKLKKAY